MAVPWVRAIAGGTTPATGAETSGGTAYDGSGTQTAIAGQEKTGRPTGWGWTRSRHSRKLSASVEEIQWDQNTQPKPMETPLQTTHIQAGMASMIVSWADPASLSPDAQSTYSRLVAELEQFRSSGKINENYYRSARVDLAAFFDNLAAFPLSTPSKCEWRIDENGELELNYLIRPPCALVSISFADCAIAKDGPDNSETPND